MEMEYIHEHNETLKRVGEEKNEKIILQIQELAKTCKLTETNLIKIFSENNIKVEDYAIQYSYENSLSIAWYDSKQNLIIYN